MNMSIVNSKKTYIFDIEQLKNVHSCVFIDKDSDETHFFVIHKLKNQAKEYFEFLTQKVLGMIGFNNLKYDYPVLHQFIHACKYEKLLDKNADEINEFLYQVSQNVIKSERSEIYDTIIPQLDLFKIHHFDNKAKRTSLKWIEGVMRMNNVEDLPFNYYDELETLEEIDILLKYNKNDVLATKQFYKFTVPDINLRKDIKKQFDIDCINYSDSKIGSEVVLDLISKEYDVDKSIIRQLKSPRERINLSDVVFPYINFKSNEFSEFLLSYKRRVITETKGQINGNVKFKGIVYNYGTGGLHASVKNKVFIKTDNKIIIDVDVASFYPAIAILNNMFPEHLGFSFCKLYKEKFDYRLSIKSDKSKKSEAGMWKLALNSVFGNSNQQFSFLYDPLYAMKTTINGQFLLTMLIERVLLQLKDSQLIQANTDGATFYIDKDQLDSFLEICKNFEKFSKLTLEYSNYKKIIVRDVNSYIAVKDKPEDQLEPEYPESDWYDNFYTKHKTKGYFEVVKTANGRVAFNKSWSKLIIPKALYNYFIYNKPVKDTIYESNDILDFCDFYKEQNTDKSSFKSLYYEPDGKSYNVSKTVRYYCSIDGGRLYKENQNNKSLHHIEKESRVTLFNKKIELPMNDYRINYDYYIDECKKLINKIEGKNITQMKFNF